MKTLSKICYYLLLFMMLSSSIVYATNYTDVAANYASLGFPAWVVVFNGIAKFLGVAVLLLPWTPQWIRDFVLAGFLYILLLAGVAHVTVQDGMYLPTIIGLVLLTVYLINTKVLTKKKK